MEHEFSDIDTSKDGEASLVEISEWLGATPEECERIIKGFSHHTGAETTMDVNEFVEFVLSDKARRDDLFTAYANQMIRNTSKKTLQMEAESTNETVEVVKGDEDPYSRPP